ncbi:MAG TPA: flagellar hook capping FlgD N-terminal domain-containing protein [Stellaceae bacterium]|nr:flagellar hook capping FlgD N-terminal domain-containing protein [Stellaceae bacterium]
MITSSTVTSGLPASSTVANTSSGISTGSTSPTDPSLLSQNFNTFLTLLTTQLQNQDPLSPLDTNQFTQQLVSFSEVEQQIDTNNNLQTLINLQNASQTISALPLVGRTINYSSNTAPLSGGQASFSYTLPTNAIAATLAVADANGNVVYTAPAATAAGLHSFTWNGTTNTGATAANGDYSLSVLAANSSGQPITSTITAFGQVDSVNVTNNVATFDVGGVSVPMSQLLTIQPSSN